MDCLIKIKQLKNLLALAVVGTPNILTQPTTTVSWLSFFLHQLINYSRI